MLKFFLSPNLHGTEPDTATLALLYEHSTFPHHEAPNVEALVVPESYSCLIAEC
jgi:hypothetical protein